jgi:anti-anti-sigma regulatory factor
MLTTDKGWRLCVQRGPGCLFVRLLPDANASSALDPLSDRLWALLEQHFTYSLVLEMDGIEVPDSHLLAEIAALADRIEVHEGMLRLCGLSPEGREMLHRCRGGDPVPAYVSRQDALFASYRPGQPR